ncbi:MAG TPA: DUF2520 domain-containing protein [Candidatus Brocadiia bacterium]|nr:DUF2520 domain-containing protein [Candidatus Brocadiia bacterium]
MTEFGRTNRRLAIIGAGKVGIALGNILSKAGHRIVGISSLSGVSAQQALDMVDAEVATADSSSIARNADTVFITTPDDAIEGVAGALVSCGAIADGSIVIHCSGALSSEILSPARACGARVGSLHPLQSFATVEQALENLPGSFCCIEGDDEAMPVLQGFVRDLGGVELSIPPEGKVLYHAAACVASNYFVAITELAIRIDIAAGIRRDIALASLLPLMTGTLNNIKRAGIPACLTGPISRGDAEIARRHLEALREALPDAVPLYCKLGGLTAEVASTKGTLPAEKAARLADIFHEFKT